MCHSWISAADEGGERSGGPESPPAQDVVSSPPASSSTPDLLADTPPQQQRQPDDDRLDLASSRPQRLLRGRSSPRGSPGSSLKGSAQNSPQPSSTLPERSPAPSAAAGEGPEPDSGIGQGPEGPGDPAVPAEVAAPEGEAPSPRGCYSTLAAHDRGPQEGSLGHELPSCFGATDPNLRRSSPPRTGPYRSSFRGSAVSDTCPSGDARSSREASPEAPARSASPVKEAEKVRGSGQPLSGLRDLLAPVGGLFKGAFGVPSSEGAALEPSSRPPPGGVHHDDGSTAPGDEPRESDSSGMTGQPGTHAWQAADQNMVEASDETLASSSEVIGEPDDGPKTSAVPSALSVQQAKPGEERLSDMSDEHQASVEERSQQAKADLMDIFSSQHAGPAQPSVHSSSFETAMRPLQVRTASGPQMVSCTRPTCRLPDWLWKHLFLGPQFGLGCACICTWLEETRCSQHHTCTLIAWYPCLVLRQWICKSCHVAALGERLHRGFLHAAERERSGREGPS